MEEDVGIWNVVTGEQGSGARSQFGLWNCQIEDSVLKNLGRVEQTEPLTCLCSWPLTLLLGVNNLLLGD